MSALKLSPVRIAIIAMTVALWGALFFAWLGPDRNAPPPQIYEEVPEDAQWVLFVGNSHTFNNNLPGMVQRLAHSDKEVAPIWTNRVVQSGATLSEHLEARELRSTMEGDDFDFVVIQGASLEPVLYPYHYVHSFQHIASMAHQQGAVPVLYEVWPRAEYASVYDIAQIPQSPDLLADAIRETTERALEGSDALLAPVGPAWERSRHEDSGISLYLEDGNHATLAGTYLAALVIYAAIHDSHLSDDLWHPDLLSSQDAATLRELANAGHADHRENSDGSLP